MILRAWGRAINIVPILLTHKAFFSLMRITNGPTSIQDLWFNGIYLFIYTQVRLLSVFPGAVGNG